MCVDIAVYIPIYVCVCICIYKAVVLPFQLKEMKAENQTCFLYLQQHLLYSGACGWWGRKDGGQLGSVCGIV